MLTNLFDLPSGVDKIHTIVIMLLDTSGDGQDVGVEDYVLRGEPDLVY